MGPEREAAERALAVFDAAPRGAPADRIAAMVGEASLAYPAARLGDREADARVAVYERELADIDADILGEAFRMAVRENRFFPSVAELRTYAGRVPAPRRSIVAGRLRRLLANRPAEVVDLVSSDQLAGLIGRLGRSLGSVGS